MPGYAARDLGYSDDTDLAAMEHAEIMRLRGEPGADQARLAPFEHRAFAREFAQESPVKAAISLPFAIPAYTASKVLGMQKSRSPASMEEVKQGYIGLAEGLRRRKK